MGVRFDFTSLPVETDASVVILVPVEREHKNGFPQLVIPLKGDMSNSMVAVRNLVVISEVANALIRIPCTVSREKYLQGKRGKEYHRKRDYSRESVHA
jgi:hypothetical protein